MLDTIDTLTDHELIARADAKLEASASRKKVAEDSLAAAQQALATAKANSEQAVYGNGSLSPADAELKLEAAQRAVRVAEKVRSAAADTHQRIDQWLPLAKGAAHGPLYMAGIRARIAAAAKADKARTMLAEAQHDFLQARTMCETAFSKGHQHPTLQAHNRQDLIPSNQPLGAWISDRHRQPAETMEIAPWIGNGVDASAVNSPWAAYVLSQEPREG